MSDEVDEASAASRGSQPVAWIVTDTGSYFSIGEVVLRAGSREECEQYIAEMPYLRRRCEIFCTDQQHALTVSERDAIEWAIAATARTYDDADGGPIKREALRRLLERLG